MDESDETLAIPVGKAPPAMGRAAGAGAPPPTGEPAKVSLRTLFHWGWYVVSVARSWFFTSMVLSIVTLMLTQYNIQVLAKVVSDLAVAIHPRSPSTSGLAPAAAGHAAANGFLAGLIPSNIRSAVIVFVVLSISLVLLRFLERVVLARTDNKMLGRLQRKLHDNLLRLGPSYHDTHEIGEKTLIVTRFSASTQLLLRDIMSTPVTQGITFATAMVFLTNNLSSIGHTPLWARAILLGALVVFPLGGWWLSKNLRAAYTAIRESDTALSNEFMNSVSLPYEVQLMGAQVQRSKAFARRVDVNIRTKIKGITRDQIAQQFEASVALILQTLFLVYAVFFALRSGNPAAAGAIFTIYEFVPAAVAPIQQLIGFTTALNSVWPPIEKVVELLEVAPDIKESPAAVELAPEDRSVTFNEVTFSYSPGVTRPVLDKLTHHFEAHQTTAIIARAGMGKSSLLNLTVRLYDPQQGAILIGDKNLHDIKLA